MSTLSRSKRRRECVILRVCAGSWVRKKVGGHGRCHDRFWLFGWSGRGLAAGSSATVHKPWWWVRRSQWSPRKRVKRTEVLTYRVQGTRRVQQYVVWSFAAEVTSRGNITGKCWFVSSFAERVGVRWVWHWCEKTETEKVQNAEGKKDQTLFIRGRWSSRMDSIRLDCRCSNSSAVELFPSRVCQRHYRRREWGSR